MMVLHQLRVVVADSCFTASLRVQSALAPRLQAGDVLTDLPVLYRCAITQRAKRAGRQVRFERAGIWWSGMPLHRIRQTLNTLGLGGYQIVAVTRSPWERLATAWYLHCRPHSRDSAWSLERFLRDHPLCPPPLTLGTGRVPDDITWLREDHLTSDTDQWTQTLGISAPLDWVPVRPDPWERLGRQLHDLYTQAAVDLVAFDWACWPERVFVVVVMGVCPRAK